MKKPKRGEIWRTIMHRRGRRGTEMVKDRPCLIVSRDSFNEGRPRLTIAPLTSYCEDKDAARPLWGIPIKQEHGRSKESDVQISPANYDYPLGERLEVWVTDRRKNGIRGRLVYDKYGNKIPFKSIIDCGQLWTVYAFEDPEEWPDFDLDGIQSDVRLDRYHGALKEWARLCVDAALQVLVDGGVRYQGDDLSYRAGQVLMAYIPVGHETSRQRCLVVSSSGVDAIRTRTPAGDWGYLEQYTVVPLDPVMEQDREAPGIAFVDVHPIRQGATRKALAMCQELYTLNLPRRGVELFGYLNDSDIDKVRKALRDYLALPR